MPGRFRWIDAGAACADAVAAMFRCLFAFVLLAVFPVAASSDAWQAAESLAKDIEAAAPTADDPDAFRSVAASIYANLGDLDSGRRVADAMAADNVDRAVALAEVGDIDAAMEAFDASQADDDSFVTKPYLIDTALITIASRKDDDLAKTLLDHPEALLDEDGYIATYVYRTLLDLPTQAPGSDEAAFEYGFAAQLLLLRGDPEAAEAEAGKALANAIVNANNNYDFEQVAWYYTLAGETKLLDQVIDVARQMPDPSTAILLLHRSRLHLLADEEATYLDLVNEAAGLLEDDADSFAYYVGYADSVSAVKVAEVLDDVSIHDDQYLLGLGIGLIDLHRVDFLDDAAE